MYPPIPPSQPPLPSDNQLEAAVRRVLGISSAPTSSTVTPPTRITSQSTTSGKCHQYVYLLPLPLLQWQSLLLAYHWLSSQPPTGSSSSSLCHSLFVTHLYLSLLSCRPPPGVLATPSSSPLLIAANLLSSPKPFGNGSSQPPAINLLHSAAPILG